MFDVDSFILVGGASSRMGTDKSLLTFGSETAIERLDAELRALSSDVSLVGSRPVAAQPGLKRVPDVHERWGALGGIHAALGACQAEWAVIVACDLPFVTRDLFWRLLLLKDQSGSEPIEAVVPIQSDGRPQPLCALYHRASCFPEAERLISSGEHTPRALLAAVRTRWVESRELTDLPGAEHFFFNVNTPDDYRRAKEILSQP